MTVLSHSLDRTIAIHAPRPVVFRFFTDPARWAAWWGAGSTIDARPGGRMRIRYPDGTEASGEVLEVAPPERIAFTYGYVTGAPIPEGGSTVTIQLEASGRGTRLRLVHAFADAAARDQHVQGWRYQLSLFANVVADEQHGGADRLVDGWFAAWAETDAAARLERLRAIATDAVTVRDRFSCIDGIEELSEHIAGAQRFMRLTLQRTGEVRHCQGTVLAEWSATAPDGQPRGRGTAVLTLDTDNRIDSVTSFWI